jgi:hypothetical protein
MGFSYYLFIVTFITFPIFGFFISKHIKKIFLNRYLKVLFSIFIIHNSLFYFGLSIKGDYFDYSVFSLEYLFLSITTFTFYNKTTLFSRFISSIGIISMIIGTLIGFIGIWLFIVISMDYETDKIITFSSNEKEYVTRRYSFGFATTSDTRTTFETYRIFDIFPLEYKIDETDFFGSSSKINSSDENLKIQVQKQNKIDYIEFSSSDGGKFSKKL